MQINSSQLHVFSEESNEFLHQRIEWQNFRLNQKQSEEHVQSHKSYKNSQRKRKSIVKQPKQGSTKNKIPKRQKDEASSTQMGRPLNENIQKDHLVINRSFNDIVYHFSRMMIFLKLKQGTQTSNHTFLLQNNQSAWMSQAQHIMSQQNFPAFEDQKPSFLLHPNSLHYVLQYKKQRGKENYNEQQIKFMLFAFLKRREMLTTTVYHYITNYWPDIIYIVNNPDGEEQHHSQKDNNYIEVFDMIPSEGQNRQNVNSNSRKQRQKVNGDSCKSKKTNKQVSQIQILKKQLRQDDSIAAYQISCYLHACCLKFQIKIDG